MISWGKWFLMMILVTLGFIFGMFVTSQVVEVDLVDTNVDSAKGEIIWQFKVDGRDVPDGESVRVFMRNFKIQVIESKSQKKVDELNIGSLIKTGDLATYIYDGENLYLYILHKDGTSREIKVNIDDQ